MKQRTAAISAINAATTKGLLGWGPNVVKYPSFDMFCVRLMECILDALRPEVADLYLWKDTIQHLVWLALTEDGRALLSNDWSWLKKMPFDCTEQRIYDARHPPPDPLDRVLPVEKGSFQSHANRIIKNLHRFNIGDLITAMDLPIEINSEQDLCLYLSNMRDRESWLLPKDKIPLNGSRGYSAAVCNRLGPAIRASMEQSILHGSGKISAGSYLDTFAQLSWQEVYRLIIRVFRLAPNTGAGGAATKPKPPVAKIPVLALPASTPASTPSSGPTVNQASIPANNALSTDDPLLKSFIDKFDKSNVVLENLAKNVTLILDASTQGKHFSGQLSAAPLPRMDGPVSPFQPYTQRPSALGTQSSASASVNDRRNEEIPETNSRPLMEQSDRGRSSSSPSPNSSDRSRPTGYSPSNSSRGYSPGNNQSGRRFSDRLQNNKTPGTCWEFDKTGSCSKGDSCRFLHNAQSQRPAPQLSAKVLALTSFLGASDENDHQDLLLDLQHELADLGLDQHEPMDDHLTDPESTDRN